MYKTQDGNDQRSEGQLLHHHHHHIIIDITTQYHLYHHTSTLSPFQCTVHCRRTSTGCSTQGVEQSTLWFCLHGEGNYSTPNHCPHPNTTHQRFLDWRKIIVWTHRQVSTNYMCATRQMYGSSYSDLVPIPCVP